MNAQITILDHAVIEARVKSLQNSLGIKDKPEAYTHAILDAIYPNKLIDNKEIITDGPDDRGVDGIYLRDHDGRYQVDIFSFKYRTNIDACARNFEENELNKLFSFITDLYAKNENSFAYANLAIKQKVAEIWSLWAEANTCQIKILLCSNGLALTEGARVRLDSFCNTYPHLSYEQIDFFSSAKLLAETKRPSEEGRLQVVDSQIFDRSDGDVKGVIANIEVNSFVDLIRDPATSSIRRYLFDDNIRVYLGDDGGYNQQIISSALADDNHLFWYQNNGIVIVCESVEYQKGAKNPVVKLRNFQIVNGAQTCHALVRAYQLDALKASNVLLLIKIFETRRPDIGQKVAIATNSQARINPRDLRANDATQRKIGKILEANGYWYERKKNQYIEHSADRRVDALKLGQMLLSYVHREPHRAKTDSDTIFGSRYNQIFNNDLKSDLILGLIETYAEIESRRDYILSHSRSGIQDPSADRFIAYGHWHVLFTLGLILEREGKNLHGVSLGIYIEEAIALVAKLAMEYKTVAQYDMFRSHRFRDRILIEFDAAQLKLF